MSEMMRCSFFARARGDTKESSPVLVSAARSRPFDASSWMQGQPGTSAEDEDEDEDEDEVEVEEVMMFE